MSIKKKIFLGASILFYIIAFLSLVWFIYSGYSIYAETGFPVEVGFGAEALMVVCCASSIIFITIFIFYTLIARGFYALSQKTE